MQLLALSPSLSVPVTEGPSSPLALGHEGLLVSHPTPIHTHIPIHQQEVEERWPSAQELLTSPTETLNPWPDQVPLAKYEGLPLIDAAIHAIQDDDQCRGASRLKFLSVILTNQVLRAALNIKID